MKFHAKNTKRSTLRHKYKVESKVREHHRRMRKVARKSGLLQTKFSKDPGVPNSFPGKLELLQKMKLARQARDDAEAAKKQALREARKKAKEASE